MGNHRKGGKKGRPGASPKSATVLNFNTGRVSGLHQTDPMGASWRAYPRSGLRQGLIDRLNAKPEGERSGDDWWQLGEYQVLEGLSAGDEAAINAGSQALMKGAHLTSAHAGCLLDLGWLLCYKGLDQMALFYLDKAAEAVPTSRDVWTLRGWACIGSGSREQAIDSFRRAVGLPGATDGDRETLASLEQGASLEQLRKDVVFRKFDDEVLRGKHGDPKDAARSGVVQFKQLLERKPDDLDLAYGLAYCHYVLGQLDHAEPLLLRVIGEKPEHADALTLLGLIAMKRERPDQQLAYYERAVRADPKHVLANTNLASIYQDKGDFHAARPLLLRAIEAAPQDDPHLPIALDLLGNSYGTIEHDYSREAELHQQAIALDPKRPMFRGNLVVALLSAGRAKDAHRALQAAKEARLVLPNQSMVENLVRLYQERSLHPYQYMQFVDQLGPTMGWPAVKPLVRRAWDRRDVVDHGERVDFLGALGMMASKTGDHELALEIWRYGRTLPGGEPFGPNLAVELSNLGRHTEALEAAETMSMETPRSWTILGNTRWSAGHYKLAIDAYRIALDKDERFLLPIGNAVAAAREGLLADDVEPFIERLRADWQSSYTATSILGQALVLQGKLSSAAECFQKALWSEDKIRTPEEIWADGRDPEDHSLLGEPNLGDHYAAAKCFLTLGRFDLLMALVARVREWPKWMNGDWMILEAEVNLATGDLDRAFAVVNGMKDQPPPRIVAAKIAIEREDFQEADRIIALGLADEEAQGFNYPEGRPDAMFRVLAAERSLGKGEPERSEELARDAVRRDPACARARQALVSALDGRAAEEERQELLADGLRRSPGHPALVAALVESLIAEGQSEEASDVFEKQRPLLEERGASVVAHRLAELLAVDRLSRLTDRSGSNSPVDSPWQWLEQLPSPLRDWMKGAQLAHARGDELAAAYGLYVSKVAEYLLVSKIMVPFRASLPDANMMSSDRHRDAARFMSGGAPPSIGGIARLLDAASRSYRSSDDELTNRFRDAVSSGQFGDSRVLRSRELVDQIMELGRARNSTAHLGDHDMAALKAATRCVVAEDRPGMLLSVFRLV